MSKATTYRAVRIYEATSLKGIGDTFTIDGKALNTISVKDGFAANAGKNLINGLARATLTSAVTGTDLETSIRTEVIASVLNAASAQGANWIGDQAQAGQINEFGRAFAHAVAGCMAGAAGASAPGSNTRAGSGCGAGALGAVVGELSAKLYGSENPAKTIAFASMMSGIAAAVAGQDAQGIAIASSTGANAAENNRLLHVSEMQRIKDLAKGDPQKEAQLTAAACAMVHCADGVPKDDPNYAYLKALQDAGANLTDEKTLLSQQKSREGRSYGSLFQYSGVDQYIIDPFTQNKTGARLLGATQAGLGALGVAGSAALCTSGIGCVAGAVTGTVSADYAQAGAKQAITGNSTQPYGEQVLQSLGLSPQAAAITYGVLGIAPAATPAIAQTFVKVAPQLDAYLLNAQWKLGQNIDDVAAKLAASSTRTTGTADRVVLGKWQGDQAGYIGEAKLNGGTWYQTDLSVYEKITSRLSPEERLALAWKVNETFLTQQMQKGVSRFDITGVTIAEIKAGRPTTYAYMEVQFMEANAANYGYQQVGNSWVKVKP